MDKQQETREQRQFYRMTQTPVPRLISSLALPTIISMMVTSIYNMADTYFVSQLGTSASGAVGIVFSLMAVIQFIYAEGRHDTDGRVCRSGIFRRAVSPRSR